MIGQQQQTMAVATLRRMILALVAVAIVAAMVVVTTALAEAQLGHPKTKSCTKATVPPPFCT